MADRLVRCVLKMYGYPAPSQRTTNELRIQLRYRCEFVGLIGWVWIALNKDDCASGMDNVLQCLTQKGPRRATEHDQCDHMMCATTLDICTHNTATIALYTWTDSHFTSPTASVPKSSLRGPDALSLVRTQGVALTFIGGKSETQAEVPCIWWLVLPVLEASAARVIHW